ncbi:hypothetical protein HDV62DRAFT_328026 [Trichoderma sp. SZMC 28011]
MFKSISTKVLMCCQSLRLLLTHANSGLANAIQRNPINPGQPRTCSPSSNATTRWRMKSRIPRLVSPPSTDIYRSRSNDPTRCFS